MRSTLNDWRWLLGEPAAPWLEHAGKSQLPLTALTSELRRHLSAAQTHLVLEQVDLRRRGAVKFEKAAEMFFTRQGLQQATDQQIASYKAKRFPTHGRVADLCCGIGGDLLGLAARTAVIGVDRDAVACLLAEANCLGNGCPSVEIRRLDVVSFSLRDLAAWHVDPDRRPHDRRTTQAELHEPSCRVIDQWRHVSPNAAVKLAPATNVPCQWMEAAELEWIGHRRECQQLVAWFGQLAANPGQTAATVLTHDPSRVRTVKGRQGLVPPCRHQPGRYVFEPHAAVLAAKLTGALAEEYELCAMAPDIPYLTGDCRLLDPAFASFEVTDVLPLDMKRLKSLLRQRGIGRLVVKKRGVPHDPEMVRKRLRVRGENHATLFLTRAGDRRAALLAQPIAEPTG